MCTAILRWEMKIVCYIEMNLLFYRFDELYFLLDTMWIAIARTCRSMLVKLFLDIISLISYFPYFFAVFSIIFVPFPNRIFWEESKQLWVKLCLLENWKRN